jgi:phosphatidylserine/phosphatidylglycerophosphate/cardiolipin synthase-like enzyme
VALNRRRRRARSDGRRRHQRLSLGTLALIALILLVVALARSLRSGSPPPATPTPASGPGVVGLFVQPDDGRAPILDELDAARALVRLQVYLLSDEEVIAALERAERRGVEVRVILEDNPFGGPGSQATTSDRLTAAGAEVRWGAPAYRFTHIKTIVVDDAVAIIMNQNLTRASFTTNREFGVITTRPADVAQAIAIFEADWERAPDPAGGPLVVSPSSSRTELLRMIEGAQRSLDIYAEVVRDQQIIEALIAADRRGVAVRIIVPDEDDEDNLARLGTLVDGGVEVRGLRGLYAHAKLIIADRQRAFLGSQNLTQTSLDLNRELGILLDDPGILERLNRVFRADYQGASPLA